MTALPVGPSEAERIAAELRAAGLCPDLTTKQIVYCLTAAWPLIEREVLARAADQLEAEYEDMAKRFGRLATVRARLESKKAVVDALRTLADRALVPPTGEGGTNAK